MLKIYSRDNLLILKCDHFLCSWENFRKKWKSYRNCLNINCQFLEIKMSTQLMMRFCRASSILLFQNTFSLRIRLTTLVYLPSKGNFGINMVPKIFHSMLMSLINHHNLAGNRWNKKSQWRLIQLIQLQSLLFKIVRDTQSHWAHMNHRSNHSQILWR